MENKYLILGSGIAGFSAANQIRQLCAEAEITMVGAEPENTYLRPLLSKTDFKNFQRDRIRCVQDDWYAKNYIRLYKGAAVKTIDRQNHRVTLADERCLSYDKCIYALGSDCFVPPIPGREKKGVLTLRTVRDFHDLRRLCMTAKTAVLIGGGVIGMEMAWELRQLGIACTILEAAPRLMARQLDVESSAFLKEHIQSIGIPCFIGVQVAAITGETAAAGVQLADGRWFPGDIVILSAGVRAVTAPAAAAGLQCDRGVVTDDTLVTSDPDILAAGDCVQCGIPNPGLWNYARVSGEIAGYNAVCPQNPKTFSVGSFPVVLSAMGMGLFALGSVEESEEVTAVVQRQPPVNGGGPTFRVNQNACGPLNYQKRFYRDGELCGAVLMGDISAMGEILKQLG